MFPFMTFIRLDWKPSCDNLAKISIHPRLPGHPMNDLYKIFERSNFASRKERRMHPRKTCFIETGYMVRSHWYRGYIQDISAGGVYVEAMESRMFSPGEDILLVAKIRVLREQIRGKIAWVGLYGMGVKFQIPELDSGELAPVPGDNLTSENESKKMGKIRNRKIRWEPSSTPNVKYRLYWSIAGGVDYYSDHADVGNVTEVNFPDDIPLFPLTWGRFELGISAINEAGNESELTKTTVHINFTVPEPPKNLRVEDM
jgi:hypothetical protein